MKVKCEICKKDTSRLVNVAEDWQKADNHALCSEECESTFFAEWASTV